MFCRLILYRSIGTYSLKTRIRVINDLRNSFMTIFCFIFRVFANNLPERKAPKKYFFYIYFYWRYLVWRLKQGLVSKKPTYYMLGYGDLTSWSSNGSREGILWNEPSMLLPFSFEIIKNYHANCSLVCYDSIAIQLSLKKVLM